jgi:3-oxoacyl-[acyl-carrier protein] reductase
VHSAETQEPRDASGADFEGQIAVVTGGGSGIGHGVARELARRGASVVIISRDGERLQEAAKAMCAEGLDVRTLAGDIADPALLTHLAETTPEVDILINNAAVFASYGDVEDVPLDEIDRVFAVDVRAALLLVRHVLPSMKQRGYGRIINISSVAASLGAAQQVAYSAAKAALEGMTRALAAECSRRGITCNAIAPGLIASERAMRSIDPEIRDCLVRATPIGRPGTVDEVAYAACFLASKRAAFITGVCLSVTGGMGLGVV